MVTVEPIFFFRLPSSLRETWDSLLAHSFPPTFQYEFEWVSAWTEYLSRDWHPFFLTVKSRDDVRGIIPLMYRDEKRRNILPFRRVKFLASDQADFSLVLADQKDMLLVVDAALSWLYSGKLRWELLILDHLVEGNPAVGAIINWLRAHNVKNEQHQGKYHYINLARPWEEIWKEISWKYVRRNANLARNRISRAGSWQIEINPDWDSSLIISRASEIHMKRQEKLGRTSPYFDKNYRLFLKRMIDFAHANQMFQSHWLKFRDQYIAYTFGFSQNGMYYGWQMAIDTDHESFYPMRLLLIEAIQLYHQKGFFEFNLGTGEAEYKTKWTKYSRKNYRFNFKNDKNIYGKAIFFLEKYLRYIM
jgi:CelD/BcsL family acetyltransferase involved in cellulose biosynthesis